MLREQWSTFSAGPVWTLTASRTMTPLSVLNKTHTPAHARTRTHSHHAFSARRLGNILSCSPSAWIKVIFETQLKLPLLLDAAILTLLSGSVLSIHFSRISYKNRTLGFVGQDASPPPTELKNFPENVLFFIVKESKEVCKQSQHFQKIKRFWGKIWKLIKKNNLKNSSRKISTILKRLVSVILLYENNITSRDRNGLNFSSCVTSQEMSPNHMGLRQISWNFSSVSISSENKMTKTNSNATNFDHLVRMISCKTTKLHRTGQNWSEYMFLPIHVTLTLYLARWHNINSQYMDPLSSSESHESETRKIN